jgi:tetratricopeptide (TPR) repeat protein
MENLIYVLSFIILIVLYFIIKKTDTKKNKPLTINEMREAIKKDLPLDLQDSFDMMDSQSVKEMYEMSKKKEVSKNDNLKGNINNTFLYANKLQNENKHDEAIALYVLILGYILKDKKNILSGKELRKKFKKASEFFNSRQYDGSNYLERVDDNLNIIPLAGLYFNCGQSHFKLKIYEQAKDYYEKALDCNSNCDSVIDHTLGCTKIYMKDFTSCIDNFDNALKKDSSYVDSYYMRAVAYSSDLCQLQDINKAILDLKKYLEFNPNDNAANKLLKALNQI